MTNKPFGFLHSHDGLIPHADEEHVLVDRKDWRMAMEIFNQNDGLKYATELLDKALRQSVEFEKKCTEFKAAAMKFAEVILQGGDEDDDGKAARKFIELNKE